MFTAFASSFARTAIGTVGMTLCAGLCLFGATAPVRAATADTTDATVRSTTVSYADLNLARASGRAVLDRRLHNAARAVCSSPQADLAARIDEDRCIRAALTNASQPSVRSARSGDGQVLAGLAKPSHSRGNADR